MRGPGAEEDPQGGRGGVFVREGVMTTRNVRGSEAFFLGGGAHDETRKVRESGEGLFP